MIDCHFLWGTGVERTLKLTEFKRSFRTTNTANFTSRWKNVKQLEDQHQSINPSTKLQKTAQWPLESFCSRSTYVWARLLTERAVRSVTHPAPQKRGACGVKELPRATAVFRCAIEVACCSQRKVLCKNKEVVQCSAHIGSNAVPNAEMFAGPRSLFNVYYFSYVLV